MFKVQGSAFEVHGPGTRNSKPRGGGFTLFELMVVIVIFSMLVAVLLNRLGYYLELAEKAAMESTLRAIKTGLQTRLAELIITRRQAETSMLEVEDPTRWLEQKPPNYAGAYREPAEPGHWYFDERQRQLVYVVNSGQRLEIEGAPGAKELRFRVLLLVDRHEAGGKRVQSVSGVTLVPVRAYRWSGAGHGRILARVLHQYQRNADVDS